MNCKSAFSFLLVSIFWNGSSNNILNGGVGNYTLVTGNGQDILDGGTSADTITSGSTLAAADTITDFTDGTDVLGLKDGLQYKDLTIAQSESDTVISAGSEYLAVLTGISASALSEADFTPVDIV